MGKRTYAEKVTLQGTSDSSIAVIDHDPNGVDSGERGDLLVRNDAGQASLYQNADGAMAWNPVGGIVSGSLQGLERNSSVSTPQSFGTIPFNAGAMNEAGKQMRLRVGFSIPATDGAITVAFAVTIGGLAVINFGATLPNAVGSNFYFDATYITVTPGSPGVLAVAAATTPFITASHAVVGGSGTGLPFDTTLAPTVEATVTFSGTTIDPTDNRAALNVLTADLIG